MSSHPDCQWPVTKKNIAFYQQLFQTNLAEGKKVSFLY